MEKVDVIDISAFFGESESSDEDRKKEILQRWDKAFQSLGFAIITGHGVSKDTVNQLRKHAREFFSQKFEEKMKCCLKKGYGKGGYVPVGVENVTKSMTDHKKEPTDFVESFCFHYGAGEGDIVPEYPIGLKNSIAKYWQEMSNLLLTIMHISSMSLGLPKDYFDPYFIKPELFLRLAYYPAQDQMKCLPNQMRYGAHTDYTGFTLLKQDEEVGGLEVFCENNGNWIPVEIVPDSFVVNAGDFLQRWTNDHWKSNLHRVVNPSTEISHKDRLSLVFFTGPNENTLISPIEMLIGKEKVQKYKPVLANDYLFQKYSQTSTKNV